MSSSILSDQIDLLQIQCNSPNNNGKIKSILMKTRQQIITDAQNLQLPFLRALCPVLFHESVLLCLGAW